MQPLLAMCSCVVADSWEIVKRLQRTFSTQTSACAWSARTCSASDEIEWRHASSTRSEYDKTHVTIEVCTTFFQKVPQFQSLRPLPKTY